MRSRLHRFAWRYWRGEGGLPGAILTPVLAILAWVWGTVTAARNRRFDREGGARVDGVRVVSVGNLAVGGTGKTPFASWVARALQPRSRPALLLSGYGSDEVSLHERWTPDVPVLAGRDRVELVVQAGSAGADVAVLDDGFQHRRVHRDLDIVLLSADDRVPGPLLPRGPYREPLEALARAAVVVVTRELAPLETARAVAARVAESRPGLETAGVHFESTGLYDLGGEPRELPEPGVMVMTAVARPHAVQLAVSRLLPGTTDLVALPDHHDFERGDVAKVRRLAGRRPLVVTEKDAVKLRALGDDLSDVLVLHRTLVWDWGEEVVRRLLDGVVEGGRRG